jgi:PleD family two-component response regulator
MSDNSSSALENYTKELKEASRNWSKRLKAKRNYDKSRELEAKEAEKQALIDPLTGLWNRRYFELQLAIEMEKATQTQEERREHSSGPLSLIIFDLDKYGGHIVGDQSLKTLTEIVLGAHHGVTSELTIGVGSDELQILRETDVVCRISGDEFAVILPNANLNEAVKIAERIRSNTEKQSIQKGAKIPFTLSLGVAEFIPGESRDHFFRRADDASYQAKESGRNKVVATEAVL